MNPSDVRSELVRALRLDLIGPGPEDETLARETLAQAPSRWYLSGFLVPYEADVEQRQDETAQEQIDLAVAGAGDDEETPEPASARKAFLPSSLGVSVLVGPDAKDLRVEVTWGDYRYVEPSTPATGGDGGPSRWERVPRQAEMTVSVAKATTKPTSEEVAESGGLRVVVSTRPVAEVIGRPEAEGLPKGTRAVSVFLVNHRPPKDDRLKDEAMAFQVALRVRSDAPFVARPNLRGMGAEDWDDQVADLQYRDAWEYAVGHGVATRPRITDGACREVATTWTPSAEVEKVEPAAIDVDLSMESLAALKDGDDAASRLSPLVSAYRTWIARQRDEAPNKGARGDAARLLLDEAGHAADRVAAGIDLLRDETVLEAFRLANRVMAVSARQRQAQIRGGRPEDQPAPGWRPFQLAFLLMTLRGIVDPRHAERESVDLLFFPTGGGKTEAYLGLAAFTLVLRRLRNPTVTSAGVTVLMRYTLRLLTLDQLARASTLICALELERQRDVTKLGTWPFEIGLWVGKAATPNRMGKKGDPGQDTARSRTIAFLNNDRKPCPISLENCPWCGTKFKPVSFRLIPNQDQPQDLRIACASRQCPFNGSQALPIVAVDEPIYRRLPCFLIATVDKFASLPWVGQVGALFGRVERYNNDGFYGPCDPGRGTRLDAPSLPPPDLIIQDELHLISGPLGTMAGLYETALEALAVRKDGDRWIRPKIVASTATIRRAGRQVKALFARERVDVFPPPGPQRRDSFFAITVPRSEKNARLYVGIGAPGRSPKVMLLRSYLALMGAAQKQYQAGGGRQNANNPADAYMTLVGYFNALRELGGSRRIVEDEVSERLKSYGSRKRLGETTGLFADRKIRYEPVELTSREPTDRVAEAKRRLGLGAADDDSVDIALATNMISVGLDIGRLGLMVVLGQPKTTAEYIQATSRVGREDLKPGLVVTLLNVHRPRDRSHYERFQAYHESFYRSVEVTSVTPFAPRAIDRGLAAVTVGLSRHGNSVLTPALQAIAITTERNRLEFVLEAISRRAEAVGGLPPQELEILRQKLRQRVGDLLDEWSKIAETKRKATTTLQYQEHEAAGPHLLYDPLDPQLLTLPAGPRKFRAHRSLRDVEPSVPLWLKRLDGMAVPVEETE